MPPFFSSAVAPLPIQTLTSEPTSRRYTSLVSSIDLERVPEAISVLTSEPEASLTLISFGALLVSTTSSDTAALTAPLPPMPSQNSGSSDPWSQARILHLPPRSSSRMPLVTSSAFAFSFLLASLPFHWMIVSDMTRINTSPLLSDAALTATGDTRTIRAPLSWSSDVSCTPRSTCLKPEATPPLRYWTDLNSCMNSVDSCPCASRCCTGPPPRNSSSSTVLYAAMPCSSCEDSSPSQKKMSHSKELELGFCLVFRQM
mmetsp:Transcript_57921/g.129136  ORF Transcript_57921/g.129136 Transcript_57921/m.129136 type:complete len:258 (-) Transcript_57921:132-905(-)